MDFVQMFPQEIIEHILKYLSGRDLSRCCCVSRDWRACASSDILWLKLIKADNFEDELLLPMKKKGKGRYKSIYEKRAKALVRWRRGDYVELKVGGVVASCLGGGSMVVAGDPSGHLLIHCPVGCNSYPPTFPFTSRPITVWAATSSSLIVGSSTGIALYVLTEGNLALDKIFMSDSTDLGEPSFRYSEQNVILEGKDTGYDVSVPHITDEAVVFYCRRNRAPSFCLVYCLITGKELHREVLDADTILTFFYQSFTFKAFRSGLVCETLSGVRLWNTDVDSTLVEHYTRHDGAANDCVVIIEAHYTTGDHVLRAWDSCGSYIRRAQLPTQTRLGVHPSLPAVFLACPEGLRLTDLKTNHTLWNCTFNSFTWVASARVITLDKWLVMVLSGPDLAVVDAKDGRYFCTIPIPPYTSLISASSKCLVLSLPNYMLLRTFS